MVNRRKLPDPSLNGIFNALSIGAQYTLSFQWTSFGLKYLVKYQKVSKYYANDCLQNFILLFMSLLTAPIVNNIRI